MKSIHTILGFALAVSSANVLAQYTPVEIYNNTHADICVAKTSPSDCQIIASKGSDRVSIRSIQWIKFSMDVHRYNIPRIWLKPDLRLQAEPSGKLYLIPAETPFPAAELPKQPVGLPLAPTRKVKLK